MKIDGVFILLYFGGVCAGDVKTANSGPYRAVLVRVNKCAKNTYPLDPDPSMAISLEVYNSSRKGFLRGNLTVIREQKQVQIKLKSYMWQNGKWKMTYLMSNIGCHGLLLHMLISAVGIKYDREICGFVKGQYVFNDLDIDPIQHIWATKMEYGRILWTTESMSRATTITCTEFETVVQPLGSP